MHLPWFHPFQTYHHLNWIEIKAQALRHNYLALSRLHPESKIAPVLKSNAYGHGLKEVAPIFDRLHPPFLVVDSLFEAYELYNLGVRSSILILGYTHPDNLKIKKLPFEFMVFDLDTARVLNQYQSGAKVHIFVDTGMSREGIRLEHLSLFADELKQLKNLKIVGVGSHLADADNPISKALTAKQLNNFKTAVKILTEKKIDLKWRHLSASAGAYKIKSPVCNLIRAGIVSYGIAPLDQKDDYFHQLKLSPALSFYATVTQIKNLLPGEVVGYSATHQVTKPTKAAVISAGYYEGVDRRLSSSGLVKWRNHYCPIIGRVSMNMTSIDVSHLPQIKVGDQVQVYSDNPQDKNFIAFSAKQAQTIPYDLLVHLAESVKRRVI